MRIVAGSAGGIPLHAPRTDIRPTMDRVKAAIFSSLAERVIGSRVLDLFAGTGSLGIEALSRGAASAVFIETNALAIDSIRRNLAKARLEGVVIQSDVFSYLARATAQSFDLIFADPPYVKALGDRDFNSELLTSETLLNALAPDGVFILEKMPGAELYPNAGWECSRIRKYGATEVAFLHSHA